MIPIHGQDEVSAPDADGVTSIASNTTSTDNDQVTDAPPVTLDQEEIARQEEAKRQEEIAAKQRNIKVCFFLNTYMYILNVYFLCIC